MSSRRRSPRRMSVANIQDLEDIQSSKSASKRFKGTRVFKKALKEFKSRLAPTLLEVRCCFQDVKKYTAKPTSPKYMKKKKFIKKLKQLFKEFRDTVTRNTQNVMIDMASLEDIVMIYKFLMNEYSELLFKFLTYLKSNDIPFFSMNDKGRRPRLCNTKGECCNETVPPHDCVYLMAIQSMVRLQMPLQEMAKLSEKYGLDDTKYLKKEVEDMTTIMNRINKLYGEIQNLK